MDRAITVSVKWSETDFKHSINYEHGFTTTLDCEYMLNCDKIPALTFKCEMLHASGLQLFITVETHNGISTELFSTFYFSNYVHKEYPNNGNPIKAFTTQQKAFMWHDFSMSLWEAVQFTKYMGIITVQDFVMPSYEEVEYV